AAQRLGEVEVRRQARTDPAPLVQAKAVQDDEDDRAPLERGRDVTLDDVDRERRPVLVHGRGRIGPAPVLTGDVRAELTAHIDEEPAERIGEPELARGTEPELPVDELVVDREVVAPVPRLGALPRQRREPRREVLGRALLAELRAFEQPRHDREELAWARRLDQVIVDLTAD